MTQALLQMDLFTPARVVVATLAGAIPARAHTPRRLCPIVIGGMPQGKTGDIDTLVVDGIKNSERFQS